MQGLGVVGVVGVDRAELRLLFDQCNRVDIGEHRGRVQQRRAADTAADDHKVVFAGHGWIYRRYVGCRAPH